MNSLITPIILFLLSIGLYFSYTSGVYDKVKELQATNANYTSAIENSKELLRTRDSILSQYNGLPADQLKRLGRIVPDTIDNVRLIIDVNGIISKYGGVVKNIKVDTMNSKGEVGSGSGSGAKGAAPGGPQQVAVTDDGRPYYSATLSFTVVATYDTFLKILRDLESSLRIVDIAKIDFIAADTEPYEYNVTIRTYWMK